VLDSMSMFEQIKQRFFEKETHLNTEVDYDVKMQEEEIVPQGEEERRLLRVVVLIALIVGHRVVRRVRGEAEVGGHMVFERVGDGVHGEAHHLRVEARHVVLEHVTNMWYAPTATFDISHVLSDVN